jgi:Bacterial regulatory helix-turn-helix proteins, AraC family
MVSIRCKMMVKSELDKLGLDYGAIDLGEVEVKQPLPAEKHDQLKLALLKSGLELMDDKKAILIEKIKLVIIEMVHYADEVPKFKNSEYLSDKLNHDYTYLSNLLYDELNLTEISYKLNYSSVAHLSNQFKKVTGLTPTFFKQLKHKKRITLDKV